MTPSSQVLEETAVVSRWYWKTDFSVCERPPSFQIERSGIMEVISVASMRGSEFKKGRILVTVGRDKMDETEEHFEEACLIVLTSNNKILSGVHLDSGGNLEFEFNRERVRDEDAAKEVFVFSRSMTTGGRGETSTPTEFLDHGF